MEHEEEKSKGFKVEDRRRFSAEGELKPEFQNDQPAAATPPPSEASATTDRANPGVAAASASPARSTQAAEGSEISFTAFMVGISTQALVHLGEIPDPQGGQPEINLAAAQQLIDIVGMLKEKTRGNLDKDEEGLIDAILFELRMKYVEHSRHS
jgi:hypothetical protein